MVCRKQHVSQVRRCRVLCRGEKSGVKSPDEVFQPLRDAEAYSRPPMTSSLFRLALIFLFLSAIPSVERTGACLLPVIPTVPCRNSVWNFGVACRVLKKEECRHRRLIQVKPRHLSRPRPLGPPRRLLSRTFWCGFYVC